MRRALLVLALLGCEAKQMRDLDLDHIEVSRDAKVHHMKFERGKTVKKLEVIGKARETLAKVAP